MVLPRGFVELHDFDTGVCMLVAVAMIVRVMDGGDAYRRRFTEVWPAVGDVIFVSERYGDVVRLIGESLG